MNAKLWKIFIALFGVFVLIIILRVTNGLKYVGLFFQKFGPWTMLFFLLIFAGIIIYLVSKKKNDEQASMKKAYEFLQKFWREDLRMAEELKLQDGMMIEGVYDSKNGTSEKMFGFNVTKKGGNERFIGVIGTQPMRVVTIVNMPAIKEFVNPFKFFYEEMPKPISGYVPTPQMNPYGMYGRFGRESGGYDNKNENEHEEKNEFQPPNQGKQ